MDKHTSWLMETVSADSWQGKSSGETAHSLCTPAPLLMDLGRVVVSLSSFGLTSSDMVISRSFSLQDAFLMSTDQCRLSTYVGCA